MRGSVTLYVYEIQAQTTPADTIRLATVLAVGQTLVAFQMTLSTCQTSSAHSLRFVGGSGSTLFGPGVAIGIGDSHETDDRRPTRSRPPSWEGFVGRRLSCCGRPSAVES